MKIRTVIYSTNAIESLNARYRRANKARGHFPHRLGGPQVPAYLVTWSLNLIGQGRARWMMRWEPALNALAITFGARSPAAETY